MHWVHQEYWRPGPQGNDIQKTNVPNLRMRFRYDNLQVRHRTSCAAFLCASPCNREDVLAFSPRLVARSTTDPMLHCFLGGISTPFALHLSKPSSFVMPIPGLGRAGGADAGAQRRRSLCAPRRPGRAAQGGAGLMRGARLGLRVFRCVAAGSARCVAMLRHVRPQAAVAARGRWGSQPWFALALLG